MNYSDLKNIDIEFSHIITWIESFDSLFRYFVLGWCSVLEHLEKTSTEHFDFAEHEREHWAPNFARAQARAPSTLITN